MSLITLNQINKYFGERHLLEDVSFEVGPGERVALIGPNGAGKTTLLNIITKSLDFESGELSFMRGVRIGYLEQLPDCPPHMSTRDVLWQAFAPILDMEQKMRQMEAQMGEGQEVDLEQYSRLQTGFEMLGGYELEASYQKMTRGLDISADMQARPFSTLSGGEKTRVNLGRIMLSGSDLLILDEPTNHLDMQSLRWLEGYLSTFKGGCLIVSHDRYFLDRVATKVVELFDRQVTVYDGNYTAYFEKKQEEMERLEALKRKQDKEIARLEFTAARMRGWGLGNKKVMRKAKALEKRIERIERVQLLKKEHKMRSKFKEGARSGDEVFYIEALSCGFERPLFERFSATVLRGERIALIGANGTGKTTFLKSITGEISPLLGQVFPGTGVKCGYLAQEVFFQNPHRTLLDTMLYEAGCDVQQARDRLAAYGFTGEDVFKTPDVLSGGEKTRLRLCLFMNTGVNTLFLDEPTNHLDILAREWFEDAVEDFSETMIFTSHDRYFISRFATRIWQIEDGCIRDFLGGYDEFLSALERERLIEGQALEREQKKAQAQPLEKKAQPAKKGADEKRKKAVQKQIEALEGQIDLLDQKMRESPDDYLALTALSEEKGALENQLLALYMEE